jgi:hypothetical protein
MPGGAPSHAAMSPMLGMVADTATKRTVVTGVWGGRGLSQAHCGNGWQQGLLLLLSRCNPPRAPATALTPAISGRLASILMRHTVPASRLAPRPASCSRWTSSISTRAICWSGRPVASGRCAPSNACAPLQLGLAAADWTHPHKQLSSTGTQLLEQRGPQTPAHVAEEAGRARVLGAPRHVIWGGVEERGKAQRAGKPSRCQPGPCRQPDLEQDAPSWHPPAPTAAPPPHQTSPVSCR